MPAELWGQQFRTQNLATRYPFDDNAQLVTDDGFTLGSDALVDASLYPIGTWTTLGLTAITTTLGNATLWLGNADFPQVCSAIFDPYNVPAAVTVRDSYNRAAGILVLNPLSLSQLQTWPPGTHTFPVGTADFAVSTLIPSPEVGLRGFIVGADVVTETVTLLGDQGVVVSSPALHQIETDVVGDPLFKRSACLDAGGYITPVFLQTINGIGPDIYGGFLLAAAGISKGATVLRINPQGTDTLVISAAGS